ncbi:MAG: hypothetical protein DRR42_23925 [Gammaproteobacteria bacterium]|nr:MAG: hypothetical protein DRR42_23925 [Gammaproteobacteria bacterium]
MNIVFDTNVLLTGFLSPQSQSAAAIKQAIEGKSCGIVCPLIISEALRKFREYSNDIELDLHTPFIGFVHSGGFKIVLDPADESLRRFDTTIKNKGDRVVAAIAFENEAKICSNDIKDLNSISTLGIECTLPDKVGWTGELTINNIVKGVVISQASGCFVIKLSMFIGREDFEGRVSVCTGLFSVENFCSLELITGDNIIKFEFTNGISAQISIDRIFTRDCYPMTIFISYNSGSETQIFVANSKMDIITSSKQPVWNSSGEEVELTRVTFFEDTRYVAHLNYFSAFPYPFSRKMVKRLLEGKVSDNPWERLSVPQMMEAKTV